MFTLFDKGGPLMYLILLCSVFALAIFLERFIHLYRAGIDTEKFMTNLNNNIRKNKIKDAIELCEIMPSPIAYIFKKGLLKYDRSREEIKQAIEDAGGHEIPRLEKNLNMLATIVQIAPLLGLLGTVTGMIAAFKVIQAKAALSR